MEGDAHTQQQQLDFAQNFQCCCCWLLCLKRKVWLAVRAESSQCLILEVSHFCQFWFWMLDSIQVQDCKNKQIKQSRSICPILLQLVFVQTYFLEILWIQNEFADLEEIYWIYGKSTKSTGNLYFIPELFYLKLGNSAKISPKSKKLHKLERMLIPREGACFQGS